MSSSLPYYQRHPRKLLEACVGMSFEVRAGYGLILDLLYIKDGRLPDDRRWIAGNLGCSTRMAGKIIDELVERGKLVLSEGFLTNNLVDNIVETRAKYSEKQRENGSKPKKNKAVDQAKGGDKRKKKEDTTPDGVVAPRKRCPPDWMPSQATNDKLREEGIGEYNRPSALARFKDHEFPKARSDWDATYRNWIRKDAESDRRNPGRAGNSHDERKRAAVELLARTGDHEGQGLLALPGPGGPSHVEAAPSVYRRRQ
ncbi:MAG: DUF1376 domain-containing protein [Caulobacter sp.]